MRIYLQALTLLLLTVARAAPAAQQVDVPDYIGTPACAGCHATQHSNWLDSHHDLAMQKPTPDTVLGDFDNARFAHFGVVSEFFRRGEDFVVRTDGADGGIREFVVEWVFGVYPLQQYLLPLEDGRLQALSIAWDSRPTAEGGQRWYHLYPDEAIPHDDPLHWTGPYQNWNTRCAECHSTALEKNYDAFARRFATTFHEEDVGCEACHGPGAQHQALARQGRVSDATNGGFPVGLAERGDWEFADGAAIARRRTPLTGAQQPETCGRCHARRSTLGEYHHGQSLSATHRLALLGQPLYHHDGQILDEVYVYGSFVQSKMYQAGVVCSNCHEPHSNQLRAEGNGVCAQCHQSAVFDSPQHHRHAADSAGGQCVACHMPAQTYMGVDARRDHSMRIPRPDLSVMLDTPNACNQCHTEQDADWALNALRDWGVAAADTSRHPAIAMADIARGDTRGVPRLLELAADRSESPLWRATALQQASARPSRESMSLALELLQAPEPLLRISAVRALAQLPPPQRLATLEPLMRDPVQGVRMEVATALAGTPLGEVSDSQREALLALFDEYRSVQRRHADMPSIQLQLGLFHAARGDLPGAEAAYREALAINPQLLGARLNLADLLRGMNREDEARGELEAALVAAPENGDAMHALGLLEARSGNRAEALAWLERSAAVETAGVRHRYVYAVALHDFGDPAAAIETLRGLQRRFPADEDVLLALTNYSAEAGDMLRARSYAQSLVTLAPDNPAYRQLAASLGAGR